MKTISNKEIYYAAMYHIMGLIDHEMEINERTRREHGRDNAICQSRIKKYQAQVRELHDEILKAENVGYYPGCYGDALTDC